MSKNKINSRLNEFFSDLNSDQEQATHPLKEVLTQGYTWETDANGLYTACDDGVKQVLGFLPSNVIGNPFVSFQLPLEDQKKLRISLNGIS